MAHGAHRRTSTITLASAGDQPPDPLVGRLLLVVALLLVARLTGMDDHDLIGWVTGSNIP